MIKINDAYYYTVEVIPFIEFNTKYMDVHVTLYKYYSFFNTTSKRDIIHERTWEPSFLFRMIGSTYEKRIEKTRQRGINKAVRLANIKFENEELAKKRNG